MEDLDVVRQAITFLENLPTYRRPGMTGLSLTLFAGVRPHVVRVAPGDDEDKRRTLPPGVGPLGRPTVPWRELKRIIAFHDQMAALKAFLDATGLDIDRTAGKLRTTLKRIAAELGEPERGKVTWSDVYRPPGKREDVVDLLVGGKVAVTIGGGKRDQMGQARVAYMVFERSPDLVTWEEMVQASLVIKAKHMTESMADGTRNWDDFDGVKPSVHPDSMRKSASRIKALIESAGIADVCEWVQRRGTGGARFVVK